MTLGEYHKRSRELAVSLFFIAPLLAVYEIGILLQGSVIRNGADVLLRNLFSLIGQRGLVVLNLALLLAFLMAALTLLQREKPVFVLFPPMAVESLLYAAVLAPIVLFISHRLGIYLASPDGQGSESFGLRLVLSMGAGVYEEVLFRAGLLSIIFHLLHRSAGVRPVLAGLSAVVAASLLFSWFHHLGPLGEAYSGAAFFFRFVSGLVLSAVFLVRGLGIAVTSHALYNILILLRQTAES
jgi:hypothetical protein